MVETAVNTFTGTAVSYILTLTALPLFDMHPTHSDALGLTIIFTVASLLRGYCVRRIFNTKEIIMSAKDDELAEYRGLVIKIDSETGEGEVLQIEDQPMFEGEDDLAILDMLDDISHDIDHIKNMFVKQLSKTTLEDKYVDVTIN